MTKQYIYKLCGKKYHVVIEKSQYQNNDRLYLGLMDAKDGEPFMDITVNIPAFGLRALDQSEILVKNYSENEGLDKWLIENGIATPTGETVESGWVQIPVMRLTEEFMEENQLINLKA